MGLYSEAEKTSIQVQSEEQEVKKLHVEQQLQESTLHGQLKTSAIFINVIFWGTKFNFVVIMFSQINGSLHYFCPARECYNKYI